MAARKRTDWLQIGTGKGYFHRVHYPLQCLVFITPLLLIYQIGAIVHPWSMEQETPNHVMAFVLMLRFFSLFGAAGSYLPLAAVVAMLLAWHLARKDKWDFAPKLYLGMALESLGWAIPVFVIGLAVNQRLAGAWMATTATAAGGAAGGGGGAGGGGLPWSWQTGAVLSVGAGIYEELLFRLVAITVLNIILVDVFEMKVQSAIPIIVGVSALVFALYHRLGDHAPGLLDSPGYYLFLTAFGVYCAGLFIFRGFGIVVGCHALYDLIVVGTTWWRGH